MEIEEKIELNKLIRKYDGDNSFILSLQKSLKTSTYLDKVVVGKKTLKILSEKQYAAAKTSL